VPYSKRSNSVPTRAQLSNWAQDLQRSVAQIPDEEHERFRRALSEIEAESKNAVQREWAADDRTEYPLP
jgi:hypothetical protein